MQAEGRKKIAGIARHRVIAVIGKNKTTADLRG
jgi:hypothetical protein